MYRTTVRKIASNYNTLRVPKRTLSNDASAGISSTNSAKFNSEDEKLGMRNMIGQYDIAIVGGGMVGIAFACALSSMPLTKQLKVAIIDSNPALGRRDCIEKTDLPDPRVSTVTPATISFFKDVGAWDYVQQNRHAFFDKMQVWDYTGLGYTRYNARDVGKEILGCVVENKVLHASLLSCLQKSDFHKTIYPSRLTSMALQSHSKEVESKLPGAKLCDHGSFVKLDLSNGDSLFAKLVVGADGAKSYVRELAGLKTTGWNYSQNAIICTVEHNVENQCAWQRFLPTGPIALLPIGDRFSNIVWTMSPKESSERKTMNEDDFVKAVNHALDYGYGPHPQSSSVSNYGDRLSWLIADMTSSSKECFEVPPKVVKIASERMVFPLSLLHSNDYASNRVVLIGDAAHTVHPLAGQGVNLGFGDATVLSKVISDGISIGSDIGEISLLRKFEAERKPANIMMMALLDGFQKAYTVDFGPLNVLRAAAFHAAQFITPLKKNIISYATGEQKWPLFS
ncbi:PREDICTED: ubiquinone biosynthesis monooxygenase COQ6, mitochondrial isoform X2 [Nelumbo nucifera]|uniref:Ubiquinone biosynthesis monooxygenase COQ6, mitochondrial n=1 Tax=Nelumbo nucifera TaxID=4432 RepID=A0A1U8B386_NELNU|nr:PREDICTED: ubiquinone biosynthesis monooxygenase COQ6, mitochondrial isoform X2 [Nelumbo nucifera]